MFVLGQESIFRVSPASLAANLVSIRAYGAKCYSQFRQQRYFMVGPLEEKFNEQAQSDPLCGRSSRWRKLWTGHHRTSERDELPVGADLHWSHFTKTPEPR